eukprot:3152682-Rhodomonas_salina.2
MVLRTVRNSPTVCSYQAAPDLESKPPPALSVEAGTVLSYYSMPHCPSLSSYAVSGTDTTCAAIMARMVLPGPSAKHKELQDLPEIITVCPPTPYEPATPCPPRMLPYPPTRLLHDVRYWPSLWWYRPAPILARPLCKVRYSHNVGRYLPTRSMLSAYAYDASRLRHVRCGRTAYGAMAAYAMSGTDLAYAATAGKRPVPERRERRG